MKTIRLSHSSKKALKTFDEGSLDSNINQLIDLVEDYMPLVDLSDESSTVANVHKDTADRINSFKLTKTESTENVIIRLLVMAQSLNTTSD